ncbi:MULTISPECIES: ABC transporter substrate-binding protein [unclassified Bilifractor]|uniref:ABC transporter substrate-binding protein n=1 Tax=unclassified Bilifractor TaxID=2815795 RepID=UPI003F8DB06D
MKNKVWKQIVAVMLSSGLALGIAGCGGGSSSGDSGQSAASSSVAANVTSASKEQEVGSSENAVSGSQVSEQETVVTSSSAEATSKHTQYPVTIKTYGSDGKAIETTYEKAPEKVLAVYQGSIETLLALGLQDHIVAAAGLDNAVPDSMKAAFDSLNYLDEFTPSKETVTMLEPDMILSWGSLFQEKTLGDTMDWINKGTNVYINSNTARNDSPRTLENEYQDILNLGIIFDVQDRAEAIVNKMKSTIADVLAQAGSQQEKPSVMILESNDDTFTNYGADSLGGDMVTQLGAELANPDASEVGKEDIIAADPDVIFVVYMPYSGDDPQTIQDEKLAVFNDDKTFQSLSAVKNGRVVPIMLSEMYAAATRTQDGIETFAKGLYPDAGFSF